MKEKKILWSGLRGSTIKSESIRPTLEACLLCPDFQCFIFKESTPFEFFSYRTLKACSPAIDLSFNPMSAMSSSLWHKAGRGTAASPTPTVMTVRSAPVEGTSLRKELSYSSLQGHADDTSRSFSSYSRDHYPYRHTFNHSEGTLFLRSTIKILISLFWLFCIFIMFGICGDLWDICISFDAICSIHQKTMEWNFWQMVLPRGISWQERIFYHHMTFVSGDVENLLNKLSLEKYQPIFEEQEVFRK